MLALEPDLTDLPECKVHQIATGGRSSYLEWDLKDLMRETRYMYGVAVLFSSTAPPTMQLRRYAKCLHI